MINEIICIGTSFTEGGGLNPNYSRPIPHDKDPVVYWYKENKGIEIKSITQYAWPNRLQKISGIKTRNLGKCGSSIEYLMRNVEEIIEKEDVSNKFFILEYSSWGRSELWSSKYNKWLVTNWGPTNGSNYDDGYSTMITTDYNFGTQLSQSEFKIYEDFLNNYFNETEFLINRDRHFLNLLYKLKSKNINYQVILLETIFWEGLLNDEIFNHRNILSRDMWGYVMDMGLTIGKITNGEIEDGHPSIEGHQHIAELIYTKLKENGRI